MIQFLEKYLGEKKIRQWLNVFLWLVVLNLSAMFGLLLSAAGHIR